MSELTGSPFFGVIVSIAAYEAGLWLYKKTKLSVFNPLLISMMLIIALLKLGGISLENYNIGGKLISFFLGPATVILAVPLYKQLHLLRKHFIPIVGGVVSGCVAAVISAILFSKLFGLSEQLTLSLVPKSITTPIGMEVSKQIGGIPSVTVAAIIITGIMGAVAGPFLCRIMGIRDSMAVGLALGTSSHAIGTTRAMELGEVQGAMSGLAIGLAGIITVVIAPLILKLVELLQ